MCACHVQILELIATEESNDREKSVELKENVREPDSECGMRLLDITQTLWEANFCEGE